MALLTAGMGAWQRQAGELMGPQRLSPSAGLDFFVRLEAPEVCQAGPSASQARRGSMGAPLLSDLGHPQLPQVGDARGWTGPCVSQSRHRRPRRWSGSGLEDETKAGRAVCQAAQALPSAVPPVRSCS